MPRVCFVAEADVTALNAFVSDYPLPVTCTLDAWFNSRDKHRALLITGTDMNVQPRLILNHMMVTIKTSQ